MGLSCKHHIPKTLSVRQLAEHKDSKLIPAGKVLDIFIAIVFLCYSEEYIWIKEG